MDAEKINKSVDAGEYLSASFSREISKFIQYNEKNQDIDFMIALDSAVNMFLLNYYLFLFETKGKKNAFKHIKEDFKSNLKHLTELVNDQPL